MSTKNVPVKVIGPHRTIGHFYMTIERAGVYKVFPFKAKEVEETLAKFDNLYGDSPLSIGREKVTKEELFDKIRSKVNSF